jgi:DNA-binding transcriptional LysR family regulator
MLIDQINLNFLKVFISVYRTRSMTKTAKELAMTQSGVSQNIKNLEDLLEVRLFDRVKHKPLPTQAADILYENAKATLLSLEKSLVHITGKKSELGGTVSIGIPIEFGNNLILPILVELGKKYSKLNFRLRYGHSEEMNRLLLKGEIDFAYVDEYSFDPAIKVEKIHDETLELVISNDYVTKIPNKLNREFFESLDYIDYLADAYVLKSWFKHHFKFSNLQFNIKASLMDVDGMSRMIVRGMGAGILPLHVVAKLKRRGHKIKIIEGPKPSMKNTISVAYVENRSFTPEANYTINYLKKEFKAPKN